MSKPLSRLLRREQWAFLARDRSAWGEHLARVRAFLGEGLQAADPSRPVLILGAGSGLEVPWALAPPDTTGWDADPWSRARTALRHRRWAPWVFADLTGGLAELEATARRAARESWTGRRRDPEVAALRLAGLLPSLWPDPAPLRAWIAAHRPGTILVANVMGQFGVVAERLVESAFLEVLAESGADLWLVHDRAVIFSGGGLELGPWEEVWGRQLTSEGAPIEASDALAGLELPPLLTAGGREVVRRERWLWPVAPGQRHLIEALVARRPGWGAVASVNPCPHSLPQQP